MKLNNYRYLDNLNFWFKTSMTILDSKIKLESLFEISWKVFASFLQILTQVAFNFIKMD